MNLETLGWDPGFDAAFLLFKEQGLVPGRVVLERKDVFSLLCALGEVSGEPLGRLHRDRMLDEGLFPAIGDWTALRLVPAERKAVIHAVLPRRSCFSRKTKGVKTVEQVLAANIDTVFILTGLDGDFSLSRIERYLVVAWNSGASPVLLLNKADLCPETASRAAEVEALAAGVPVHAVSAATGAGVEGLSRYFERGKTVALIGSSGVGKSTLINRLAGEERQVVHEISRRDGTGLHTTTHRELVLLPGGGIVIDNPGLREIQLWADEKGLEHTFADIESLAESCRFRDCRHEDEPGCAVANALSGGGLDRRRLDSYRKLRRELERTAFRQEHKARVAEKKLARRIRRTMDEKQRLGRRF